MTRERKKEVTANALSLKYKVIVKEYWKLLENKRHLDN